MLADWRLAAERYGAHPEIRAVFHFSAGGGTQWVDLTSCIPALR